MDPITLLILDWFFNLSHFVIVVGLCFGWISRQTRVAHRALISVVTLCWLAIGPLTGKKIGYCPVTDWGWQVRRARGETDLEYGYINYLTEKLGVQMSDATTDIAVGSAFAAIWVVTAGLWWRDWRRARRRLPPTGPVA